MGILRSDTQPSLPGAGCGARASQDARGGQLRLGGVVERHGVATADLERVRHVVRASAPHAELGASAVPIGRRNASASSGPMSSVR